MSLGHNSSMGQLDGYRLLQEGAIALSEIEQRGIRVDVEYCDEKVDWAESKFEQARRRFDRTPLGDAWRARFSSSFNYNSTPQLRAVLGADFHVKSTKETDGGDASADEESLRRCGVEGAEFVLRMRRLNKIKNVLLGLRRSAIKTGDLWYAHPSFWLHTVATYRSSSSDPNLQNVPVRDAEMMEICRRAILASPGYRLLEVDFKGVEVAVAACVVGNTLIDTLSGKRTIRQITWMLGRGKSVYVFGYDTEEQRVAISRVTSAGMTRKKAEVWKVSLDNGESIVATPDHKFLLRNGNYARLDELSVGSSLMPLYRKTVRSKNGTVYRKVYLNNGEHILEHNLVALDVAGTVIKGSNLLVHHWDHNGCNNDPDNIEIMTRARHMRIHSIEGWEKSREGHSKNHFATTEEGKKFYAELNRKNKERVDNWTDAEREEFGNRISEAIRRRGGLRGTNNPMFGRTHSAETIALISKIRSEQKIPSWCKGLTKETEPRLAVAAAKMSATKLVNPTPAWNRGLRGVYTVLAETREKLSIAALGRVFKESTCKLLSDIKIEYWKNKKDVQCVLCGRWMRIVTNTHLIHKHNMMTIKEYKETLNHKVASVEFYGYEDVFNMNVEGIHNYATSAGVIVKNCYHQDPTMLAYLRDPKSDMHGDMAVQIYRLEESMRVAQNFEKILRQSSKNGFVFPEFYGDYFGSCAVNMACNWLKMPQEGRWRDSHGIDFSGAPVGSHLRNVGLASLTEFTDHLEGVEKDFWGRRFRVYNQWRKDWYEKYQKTGEFQMKTGFIVRGLFAKNQVVNYPVQGAAFHALLWFLVRLVRRLRGWRSGVVAEVHDSALIDVHPDEFDDVLALCYEIVEDLKREWSWLIAPMTVEAEASPVNGSWADKRKLH